MTEVLESLHPQLRDLPGATIVERYRVDQVLGVGGMGAVFRGRHLGLERDVAIKVLHPDLTRDPEISKRFDREAHSASRLDHPNCLRVTDVGSTSDGMKFMVMDLLSGGELADRLGEPLTAERSVLMVVQILRGLEHAHENGVIHRDVKPENIFITRDHEGREILKLVDFGIAKLIGGSTDTRMTKAGLIFGTPAYMSPEQAMGMEADGRADLYAVGVILYEMLGGSPPFENDDPVKLVRMQVSMDPPALSGDIAPALSAVVMKLLAKDRDDRFQTAAHAREALELVLPSIASSEVISGATIHGSSSGPIMVHHSTSGPILVQPGGSGSISIPPSGSGLINVPTSGGASDTSIQFSPSALPTLPPHSGAAPAARGRSRLPLVGVGAAVLALGIWWVARDGDAHEQGSEETAVATVTEEDQPAAAGEGAAKPAEPAAVTSLNGPDAVQLAEVDRLTFANKLIDAQTVLQPLLDDHPDDPVLAWRQGRIFAKSKRRKNRPKALAAYGDALDADPKLLADHDFYAELTALLEDPKLRSEALDFALRKMGSSGHKMLLGLVNNEKSPMGYNDRLRALEELSKDDDNDLLVDWRLHRALDLLQATESRTPCAAYGDALESMAATPQYWYLARVNRAELPKPKTGEELSEEDIADGQRCAGLAERRAEVIVELEALAPAEDSDGDLIIDDDATDGGAAPEKGSKTTGSKSSGSRKKSSSGSSGCNTPFGIFKKKCR